MTTCCDASNDPHVGADGPAEAGPHAHGNHGLQAPGSGLPDSLGFAAQADLKVRLYVNTRHVGPKPGPKPEVRSPKPEVRSPKPEARSPKPDAYFSASSWFSSGMLAADGDAGNVPI